MMLLNLTLKLDDLLSLDFYLSTIDYYREKPGTYMHICSRAVLLQFRHIYNHHTVEEYP